MNLTPSQRLIYNLLQDGYPHSKDELRRHLEDDLLDDHAISAHIYNLRKKINGRGLDVVCRNSSYQMVRLLHSAYDGRR